MQSIALQVIKSPMVKQTEQVAFYIRKQRETKSKYNSKQKCDLNNTYVSSFLTLLLQMFKAILITLLSGYH